tara:strand:- start:1266 stop:2777 length:1512 start_codon:yes stop_codon:yes gene_type:complete
MNNEIPNIIGEGTYGCVHSPQLFCHGTNKRDINKVSKLMYPNEGIKEMREYVLIDKVDKKKNFYLGKPSICIPGYDESNLRAIKKCEMAKNIDYYPGGENLSLLLMENGGLNLRDFSNKFQKNSVTKENKEKINDFWIECHRLFMGLILFSKHDIIHHDLKAGNIVYNQEKNRINYIDFGLMNSKKKVIKKCKKSSYWLANPHWSFPVEMELLNKKIFNHTCTISDDNKTKIINNLGRLINNYSSNNQVKSIRTLYSISIRKPDKFQVLNVGKYLGEYLETLKYVNDDKKYEEFLKKSVSTIDSFGLACGLMDALCDLDKFMDPDFVKDLASVFMTMLHPNIMKRANINDATNLFEECIRKHLLKDRNQQFKKHNIVKETKTTSIFDKNIENLKQSSIAVKSKKELEKLMVSPKCPDNKELNSITGKCVVKCANGYSRDKDFKCKKSKLTDKDCPEGKILNPRTNRCIKKPATKKNKVCPEGKILNPKTNRCIKKPATKKKRN